jgi:hypothetical protein
MSKYIGVTYCAGRESTQKWKAEITLPNKVKKLLGYFRDEREAAISYDIEAAKYGKPTNILKKRG